MLGLDSLGDQPLQVTKETECLVGPDMLSALLAPENSP